MVKGKVTEGKQAEEALFKFYTTELATMALNFLTGANDVNVEEQVGERRSATFSAQTHYRGLVKHSQYPDMDKRSQTITSSSYDFHNILYHHDSLLNNNTNFNYFNYYNFQNKDKEGKSAEEIKKKTKLLKITADAGSCYAQAALGKVYLRAEGGNVEEGLRYLNLASQQGNAYAKFDLANFYFFGVPEWGISKDLRKAASLFTECTGVFHEAQEILGRMYYLGEGVEKNLEEAARLFKLARDRGNVTAEAMLELMKVREEVERENPRH